MKYELTDESIQHEGRTLYRIRALKDFGVVKVGDLGGYVESEENLSQFDTCWVGGNAKVFEDAWVFENAKVFEDAWVYGNAWVYNDAYISGNAKVFENAKISEDAWVYGRAQVFHSAWISGDAHVHGNAEIYGNAWVYEYVKVCGDAEVYEDALVSGDVQVSGDARVTTKTSKTPLILSGLRWNVTITDEHMRIGCECHMFDEWVEFTDKQIDKMDKDALEFWNENKNNLLNLCESYKTS